MAEQAPHAQPNLEAQLRDFDSRSLINDEFLVDNDLAGSITMTPEMIAEHIDRKFNILEEVQKKHQVDSKRAPLLTKEQYIEIGEYQLSQIRDLEGADSFSELDYAEVTQLTEKALANFLGVVGLEKKVEDPYLQATIAGLQAKLASRVDLRPYEEPKAHRITEIVNTNGNIYEVSKIRGLRREEDLFSSSEKGFTKALLLAGGNNAEPEVYADIHSKRADMYALMATYKARRGDTVEAEINKQEALADVEEAIHVTEEFKIDPELAERVKLQKKELTQEFFIRPNTAAHVGQIVLAEAVAA